MKDTSRTQKRKNGDRLINKCGKDSSLDRKTNFFNMGEAC